MSEQETQDRNSGSLPLLSDEATQGKCGKCDKPSVGLHPCPYASEINDNDDPEYCNCCDDCTYDCCMEI